VAATPSRTIRSWVSPTPTVSDRPAIKPAPLESLSAAVPSFTGADAGKRRRPFNAAIVFLWLALSTTTLVGVFLSQGTAGSQLLATWGTAAIFLAASAWVFASARFGSVRVSHAVLLLLTLRLIALFGQPLLEDDHYRYLWDGYITATSGAPYAHAPAHFFSDASVPPAMQAVLNGINNPETPTVYGPLLQVVFAACYKIAPASLLPLKAVLLMAELAVLGLLASAKAPGKYPLMYAIHPVLLQESAFTAHPDVLLGLLLLAAVLAWRREHLFWAGVLVASAVAAKISAVVVLPLFFLNHRGRPSIAALAGALASLAFWYGPFAALASGSELAGMSTFSQQWTFNPLGFSLLRALLQDQHARIAAAALFAAIWLAIALHWQRRLRTLASTGEDAGPPPGRNTVHLAPFAPAKAWGRTAPFFTLNSDVPNPPIVAVLCTLLLLSPVVNPWYWMWLLPLACLRWSWTVQLASAAGLLAYAHVLGQLTEGSTHGLYQVPAWATAIELLVIGLAMYTDISGKRLRMDKV
jgi:alpha-1,6-mannosyltransferase